MLVELTDINIHIFHRMAQSYEAEFSAITHKRPNSDGTFDLDTKPEGSIKGYFWFIDSLPAGFILFDSGKDFFNVNEFYILPCFRNNKAGEKFFLEILKLYPGNWEVKQLPGATKAITFWVKVISSYTNNNYSNEEYVDDYWGKVRRQQFRTKNE